MSVFLHISSPLSVMRILQPAGSAAAMIEDTNMKRKRRNGTQEVIVMLKTQKKKRKGILDLGAVAVYSDLLRG